VKISLVTPCFQAARFIRETIDSVLAQDGVDLEYGIMDGASRDGTVDIIRSFESRLAWWVSERDAGQTDALNKGLARTTGEILGFLNADDVLMPGALPTVAKAFAENPEIDIVYGGVEWIDADGRAQGLHAGDISSLGEVLDIQHVWWAHRQWVQPEVFFRRRLWERVGAFDTRYHLAFDYDYWVRCFLAGARVKRLPETLVRFRLHAEQKSTASRKASDEIRDVVSRALSENPPIDPSLRRRIAAELSYDLYQGSDEKTRPSFLRALLSHPEWLWHCGPARDRLKSACIRLFHRADSGAH
jgi:glycosyltransferase involved in cell wall biosynthesis